MNHFIPREKLGKKARKKLDCRQRKTWPISPATKVFESKKQYSRKRKSHDYLSEWNHGIFIIFDEDHIKNSDGKNIPKNVNRLEWRIQAHL